MSDNGQRFEAYYYAFDATGDEGVDAVLSAVAYAGRMAHHTEGWQDDEHNPSQMQRIQQAANKAAADRAAALTEPKDAFANISVYGDWIVEDTGEHTCGTGPSGYYGQHEPGCGLVPIMPLTDLPGMSKRLAEEREACVRRYQQAQAASRYAEIAPDEIVSAIRGGGPAQTCEWCDQPATTERPWPGDDRLHPSCGTSGHGLASDSAATESTTP
jgi:hypothetical protein